MRYSASSVRDRGQRARSGRKTGGLLCYLVFTSLLATVVQAQTPAGTQIIDSAQATYEDLVGQSYSVTSNALILTVGQLASIDIEPPASNIFNPGVTAAFGHTLTNLGNGVDSISVTVSSLSGWTTRVYEDVNGDGALDAGDTQVTGPITLAAGETKNLLAAVDIPASASVRGTTDTLSVDATSEFDSSVTDALEDEVQVQDAGIAVTLAKAVDQSSGTAGDNLTYTIDYSAAGSNSATDFEIADTIPAGATYIAGTLLWNGVPQTDAAGDDAGWYDAANDRVLFWSPTIAGGASGTAEFQASIDAGATGSVSNRAGATYLTVVGPDSIGSNTVQTGVVYPELFISKALTSSTTAMVGEDVEYTIQYGNGSTTAVARNVTLTDTIPVGLDFVSAQPAPQVSNQVLTWSLGELQPGDTLQITLTTRVSENVRDTVQVRNVAVIDGLNAPAEVAVSEEVELVGVNDAQLALEKSADVLEVGIGETVPYTLVVENTGLVSVSDVVIHDLLPEGGRYSDQSLIGADSIHVNGRELTIFVTSSLAPGTTRTIRYTVAIVSAASDVVENRAYASAQGQFVTSEEAVAWVRISTNWPMETRAAIGKVWIDNDGDGVQDPGEPGVAGIDIWSGNGVVATSDADGKFSFVNLRAGQHSFRLDQSTVPMNTNITGGRGYHDLAIRAGDGWTTPRINFPLVPTEGQVQQVYLPFSWQFLAWPIHDSTAVDSVIAQPVVNDQPEIIPVPVPEIVVDTIEVLTPLILEGVNFETSSSRLTEESFMILHEVVESLLAYPDVRVEIAGHTDSTGPLDFNMRLAPARASSVMEYLIQSGVDSSRLIAKGYGPFRPIATNATLEGRAQNRRVELNVLNEVRTQQITRFRSRLQAMLSNPERVVVDSAPEPAADTTTKGRLVEYELVLTNEYDVPLTGIAVSFEPAVDSVLVLSDDSLMMRDVRTGITLATVASRSKVTVRGWTTTDQGSAVAFIAGSDRPADRLEAEIHNPLRPVSGVSRPRVIVDSLPNPDGVPPGSEVEVVIAPNPVGWPIMTLPLSSGWRVLEGTTQIDHSSVLDPTIREDRDGQLLLQWALPDRALGSVNLRLGTAAATRTVEAVTVPALRTAEEREQDRNSAFVAGPGVEMFNPDDGTVLQSNRLFVGVRGEAGAPVTLFDGDSIVGQANLRVDGVHDFIGVPLTRGPHRLRVRMLNSWNQERWDSMTVHVSDRPASFQTPTGKLSMIADGQSLTTVRVRLIDQWGVPVVVPTNVTVKADLVELNGTDSDASSVGMQIKSDAAGWVVLQLKPGHEVGQDDLELMTGSIETQIPLELLPAVRPFMLTGIGRIGIGASPDALGTITARGSLDHRTSVVLSYDSRRLNAGRDVFDRAYNPLEEAQYPILGDASQLRTLSASRNVFAARVERGFDWVAVGDIATDDFASGLNLTTYRRALTGGAARIITGQVVWQGFGSVTRQSLQQVQIRGAGTSGPYTLEPDVIPGSERITIETRAVENAERVINRQATIRFVDYQIDYESGALRFKQPIPAADPYGNSVFVVVTYEVERSGDRRMVAGLRASMDASQLLHYDFLDSLRIGVTGIRADEPLGAHNLAGVDMRLLRFGGFDVGAEVSYSGTPDSSGFATAITGAWHGLNDAVTLSGGWTKIGDGFGNPSNVALQSATEEVKLGGSIQLGESRLSVSHDRQNFRNQGVNRARTAVGVTQPLGRNLQLDASGADDQFDNPASNDRSQAAELKLTWTPLTALKLWTEGRRQFSHSGDVFLPSHLGVGAEYEIRPGISLEARHLRVAPQGTAPYSVSRLGLRSSVGFGTQVWGSYQLAGAASGSRNAAIIGLNNNLRLGSALTVNTMFERRVGLENASVGDPVRAMPFIQMEEDYWSFGMGLELLPSDAPYRLSGRGEYRDGDFQSSRLVTLAGDLSINRSFAILSLQEYQRIDQYQSVDATQRSRLYSLWGAAFRPINTDALNVLTKFSWLDESNPRLGALTQIGDEQRLIGAAELIWSPAVNTELAGRYAVRRSVAQRPIDDGPGQRLESWADYLGMRVQQNINPWLAVRAEGRLLLEHTSGTRRWDATPTLAFMPIREIEIAAGYRFGDLMDPDFTVHGGFGWFVTLGARVTESVFPSAADFWREKFGR